MVIGMASFLQSLRIHGFRLNPLTGDINMEKKFSEEEYLMPTFHRDFMLIANYKLSSVP